MRRAAIAMAAVLAACTFGVAAAPAAGCPLAGAWSQYTPGIGSSVWNITAAGTAVETGLGGARGTARLGGGRLRIDWTVAGTAYAGYYQWTLDATCRGEGELVFTGAARHGEHHASSVRGPAPALPPRKAYRNDLLVQVAALRGEVRVRGAVAKDSTDAKLAGAVRVLGRRLVGDLGRIPAWRFAPDRERPHAGAFAVRMQNKVGPDVLLSLNVVKAHRYVHKDEARYALLEVSVLSTNLTGCAKGTRGTLDVNGAIVATRSWALLKVCGLTLHWSRLKGSQTQVAFQEKQLLLDG